MRIRDLDCSKNPYKMQRKPNLKCQFTSWFKDYKVNSFILESWVFYSGIIF